METTKVHEKETVKDTAEDLIKHAGDYIETLYKKTVLQLTQKVVNTGASLISGVLAVVVAVFAFFFLNVALAWWIGAALNSPALGFLIVGAVYLLLFIILLSAKKSFVKGLRNMLIRKIYD
jgi:ABC-type multidrug transport system fused ATPase/permease subunit